MVGFQVADRWFKRLASFKPAPLLCIERFELAPMDDFHAGIHVVNAAIAQIDNDLLWPAAYVFQQDARLLQLRAENMAVIGVTRETACADDEPLTMRDG